MKSLLNPKHMHDLQEAFTASYVPIFFFNDTATTEIYTLSLHDALPIWRHPAGTPRIRGAPVAGADRRGRRAAPHRGPADRRRRDAPGPRSRKRVAPLGTGRIRTSPRGGESPARPPTVRSGRRRIPA